MDFDLSPEQQQLSDAITRWTEKNYSFEQRKQIIHSDAGISEHAWKALAELGVLAYPCLRTMRVLMVRRSIRWWSCKPWAVPWWSSQCSPPR